MRFVLAAVLGCGTALAQTNASAADQKFVDFAAQTDMMEAHLAQMAQDQADAQAVKDYAQMLNSDHTKDYTMLTDTASKDGLTVPKGLDAKHDAIIRPFEKLKGAAFDHKYITTMISGHEQAITEYKHEAADGQNADIKQYATNALPVLQKHLDGAKNLEKEHTK